MSKTNGKNPAAVALGRKRWAGISDQERSEQMAKVSQGRAKIPPERRREIAMAGVAARKKKAASKKSRRKAKPRKG